MFPVVFRIGSLPIRSYGVLIALSFAIGIALAVRRGRSRGIDPARITDLSIVILLASVAGARLFYILPYWEEFSAQPWSVFEVWRGGLTMYGGLLGAILASAVFMRNKKMPFWRVSDVVAPSVALGLGITRIGCFLNGCCFGVPTASGWGVRFPPNSAAGSEFYGVPLHPTQIYDSLLGFGLFVLLVGADRWAARPGAGKVPDSGERPRPLGGDGRLFLLFLGLYGLSRFFLDRIRYYEDVSIVGFDGVVWTWNQLLSLLLVAGAALLYRRRGRKA
ncbi:MAG: prolipoprotein diacylglyceryl transferase [Candidatus Eisenbacteria bacterium]